MIPLIKIQSRIQSCVNQIESLVASSTAAALAHKLVAQNSTFNSTNITNYKDNGQQIEQYVQYEVEICSDIQFIDDRTDYNTTADIQDIYF